MIRSPKDRRLRIVTINEKGQDVVDKYLREIFTQVMQEGNSRIPTPGFPPVLLIL